MSIDQHRLALSIAALREDAEGVRRRLVELPENAPAHWRPNILQGWRWTMATWERQTIEGLLPARGRGAAREKRRAAAIAEIRASAPFLALVKDLVAWGLLEPS